ncbi:hypothetical protein [Sphingobacterium endophyticum]|uniref:hypothetical protein n=1 Tax=Sphingobacterium endophyticum TaxID=2546448 RepID=UPI0012E181A7|nr:hypothetical protein [Sphingobacterium endophyticum]
MNFKTFLFALILGALFLSSCGSGKVWSRIGMTEQEFLETKKNRKRIHLVQQTLTKTVYKANDFNFFYYFQDKILVEQNQGQRQSDFILENRNR